MLFFSSICYPWGITNEPAVMTDWDDTKITIDYLHYDPKYDGFYVRIEWDERDCIKKQEGYLFLKANAPSGLKVDSFFEKDEDGEVIKHISFYPITDIETWRTNPFTDLIELD